MAANRRIHEPFVYTALAIALTGGFGLAAILVAALGFQQPLGTWWVATVQAHGHAQLFGWVGLFVIGVGLYFLPRLRGTVLAHEDLAPWVLDLLTVGIVLRVTCQILLALVPGDGSQNALWADVARVGLASSAVLEDAATAIFIFLVTATFRRARPLVADSPIRPVRPYLIVSLASFVFANILNSILSFTAAWQNSFVIPTLWDNALVTILIMGFIVPMTLVFAIRNLPLFMRLPFPPRQALFPILASYVTGVILRVLGEIIERPFGPTVLGTGLAATGLSLLAFIWTFDILLRRKQPWTVSRTPPPPGYVETRKPTRAHYPDYGEYGRFELLILSAFVWLVSASVVSLANGISMIGSGAFVVNPDAERHSLTLGYITLLISGMAVRMLPGFSGKRRVASPALVLATFWIGNLAAVLRVVPLFVPGLTASDAALGLSGAVGWIAIACLAANMWLTFRS